MPGTTDKTDHKNTDHKNYNIMNGDEEAAQEEKCVMNKTKYCMIQPDNLFTQPVC